MDQNPAPPELVLRSTSDTIPDTGKMDAPPAILLNCYPPPTGIWRYARVVSQSLGVRSKLATMCIGNHDFSTVEPGLSSLVGVSRGPPLVRTALNVSLPRFTTRRLSADVRDALCRGGVVHYLIEDIRPWHAGKGVLVTIHGNPMATLESDEFYSFNEGYKFLLRRNLTRYSRVALATVQSDYVRKGLEEWGYGGEVRVVPPAIDLAFLAPPRERDDVRRELGLPLDRRILLSVSTAERRKNLGILAEVMDLLPRDCLLVRVGPQIRGSMVMPRLTDTQLADLYHASDALIFPTLEEGFGYPVIEAFATGLPVVSSAIPVIEETAAGAAVLVEPTDAAGIARGCKEVLEDRESFERLGTERARKYTVGLFRERLLGVYAQATEWPPAAG